MIKITHIFLQLFGITALLLGCASSGKSQAESVPLPPKNLTSNHTGIYSQLAGSKQAQITESLPKSKALIESQTFKHRRYSEERSYGGAVNRITVTNPGRIPSYYIYPTQQQELNVNDNPNPNKISTSNWQLTW